MRGPPISRLMEGKDNLPGMIINECMYFKINRFDKVDQKTDSLVTFKRVCMLRILVGLNEDLQRIKEVDGSEGSHEGFNKIPIIIKSP